MSEFLCSAGPEDKAFEERHDWVTMALVASGTFLYRTDSCAAVMHPGSFLLGNSGQRYECGHEHSRGDRCIALSLDPGQFEEIAASAAGKAKFRFPVAALPAMNVSAPLGAKLEALARCPKTIVLEETGLRLATAILGLVSGLKLRPVHPSARDAKRIGEAIFLIESQSQGALNLEILASHVAMSKFHFLRTFGRIVGMSPYRYLLNTRLRRVAVRLRTSDLPVAHIAFEEGFGDLSTFNRQFRDVFGASPLSFRASKVLIDG